MDGSPFDRLTRALGSGLSRRAALKVALGLGAGSAVGDQLNEPVLAARRPTPTPRPAVCPGSQVWNGSECVC